MALNSLRRMAQRQHLQAASAALSRMAARAHERNANKADAWSRRQANKADFAVVKQAVEERVSQVLIADTANRVADLTGEIDDLEASAATLAESVQAAEAALLRVRTSFLGHLGATEGDFNAAIQQLEGVRTIYITTLSRLKVATDELVQAQAGAAAARSAVQRGGGA